MHTHKPAFQDGIKLIEPPRQHYSFDISPTKGARAHIERPIIDQNTLSP